MTPESRYKLVVTCVMAEEGKTEAPMMDATITYNGLPYPAALMIEKGLIDLQAALNAAGMQMYEAAKAGPATNR